MSCTARLLHPGEIPHLPEPSLQKLPWPLCCLLHDVSPPSSACFCGRPQLQKCPFAGRQQRLDGAENLCRHIPLSACRSTKHQQSERAVPVFQVPADMLRTGGRRHSSAEPQLMLCLQQASGHCSGTILCSQVLTIHCSDAIKHNIRVALVAQLSVATLSCSFTTVQQHCHVM